MHWGKFGDTIWHLGAGLGFLATLSALYAACQLYLLCKFVGKIDLGTHSLLELKTNGGINGVMLGPVGGPAVGGLTVTRRV